MVFDVLSETCGWWQVSLLLTLSSRLCLLNSEPFWDFSKKSCYTHRRKVVCCLRNIVCPRTDPVDDADGATTGGSDRRAQFELWASGQLMTFKKLLSPINLLKLLVSLPKTHIRETANFRNLHQILESVYWVHSFLKWWQVWQNICWEQACSKPPGLARFWKFYYSLNFF